MNKLLYISDQEEYSDNGTISTLFDNYLKAYWDVDLVYITPYKHSYQKKGNHHIVPKKWQKTIISYLATGNDMTQYDFVFVRNKKDVLKDVLKHKEEFNYKVGYRISYPKQHHKLELIKSFSPLAMYQKLQYKMKIIERDKLVNQCDLFMPASPQAHSVFYPNIKTEAFPIYIGLDPEKITEHTPSAGDTINFVNVGGIDALREFDVILDAFEAMKESNWHLHIIVSQKTYVNELLKHYPTLKNKITVYNELHTLHELRDEISKHDVGIAMLPRNNFHDTVIANKVIHYASRGLPSLMTSTAKNHSIFSEEEALFSEFDSADIRQSLQIILKSPKEKLVEIGKKSQDKLLKLKRNYKILAHELAETMDKILEQS
jgi:hypothetical protein